MDLTAAADYLWQAQPGSFWKAPQECARRHGPSYIRDKTPNETIHALRCRNSLLGINLDPPGLRARLAWGASVPCSRSTRRSSGSRPVVINARCASLGGPVKLTHRDPFHGRLAATRRMSPWTPATLPSVAPRDHWVSTLPKPASTKGTPTRSQAVPSDSASAQGLGG